MASELLHSFRKEVVPSARGVSWKAANRRMRKDSLIRFSAVVLALMTATAVVFAVINFQKESQFSTPYDGVWWVEQNGGLVAKGVDAGGPGERAGIKAGDRLLSVSDQPKQASPPGSGAGINTRDRTLDAGGPQKPAIKKLALLPKERR